MKFTTTLFALTVLPAMLARGDTLDAARAVDAGRYTPGAPLDITVTLTKEAGNFERITGLYLRETLPEGWTVGPILSSGHAAQFDPVPGSTNTLELLWVDIPEFPCVVRYRVNVPVDAVSNVVFSGKVKWTVLGNTQNTVATTGGAIVSAAFHSADIDKDHTISRADLDRVVELHLAGQYSVNATTDDGYQPGPGPQDGFPHDSDLNKDWGVAMRRELFRAVQMYHAPGYFPDATSPDKFTLYVPVLDVTGIPTSVTVGSTLTLNPGFFPPNALNQGIIWTLVDDGGTHASLTGNVLADYDNKGVVTLRATVADGAAPGVDYTQDFQIAVHFEYLRYMVVDLSGGSSATAYPVSFMDDPPMGGWTDAHKTTHLVMRRLEAGTFEMGSPLTEPGRGADEDPRTVTLSQDYYIGVFEVTQKQWQQVMGTTPSNFATDRDMRPVERVGYDDVRGGNWPVTEDVMANTFMDKIIQKADLPGFDLPTEEQWEFACRAGEDGPFNFGAANPDDNMRYAANSAITAPDNPLTVGVDKGTAAVGSYLNPNAFGLYDMHGNVREWCRDWYEASGFRVLRGGGWQNTADECRSAARDMALPSSTLNDIGFRPVWPVPAP